MRVFSWAFLPNQIGNLHIGELYTYCGETAEGKSKRFSPISVTDNAETSAVVLKTRRSALAHA